MAWLNKQSKQEEEESNYEEPRQEEEYSEPQRSRRKGGVYYVFRLLEPGVIEQVTKIESRDVREAKRIFKRETDIYYPEDYYYFIAEKNVSKLEPNRRETYG